MDTSPRRPSPVRRALAATTTLATTLAITVTITGATTGAPTGATTATPGAPTAVGPAASTAAAAEPVDLQAPTLLLATSTAGYSSSYESAVQSHINRRRAARGLPRLRLVSCADGTAESWSRHLASTGAFYHQSMDRVLDRCDARYAGETLGRGTMTPRRLVRLWMRSSGHRAILLSRQSRRIGVGATTDANGRWVVAANFVRL